LLMRPGSQFGDHAAKVFVYLLVRRKIGKDFAIFYHRCRGIVAGGFNPQNVNVHLVFLTIGKG